MWRKSCARKPLSVPITRRNQHEPTGAWHAAPSILLRGGCTKNKHFKTRLLRAFVSTCNRLHAPSMPTRTRGVWYVHIHSQDLRCHCSPVVHVRRSDSAAFLAHRKPCPGDWTAGELQGQGTETHRAQSFNLNINAPHFQNMYTTECTAAMYMLHARVRRRRHQHHVVIKRVQSRLKVAHYPRLHVRTYLCSS